MRVGVIVRANVEDGALRPAVSDNGIGSAVGRRRAGTIGLQDRVEVLGELRGRQPEWRRDTTSCVYSSRSSRATKIWDNL